MSEIGFKDFTPEQIQEICNVKLQFLRPIHSFDSSHVKAIHKNINKRIFRYSMDVSRDITGNDEDIQEFILSPIVARLINHAPSTFAWLVIDSVRGIKKGTRFTIVINYYVLR